MFNGCRGQCKPYIVREKDLNFKCGGKSTNKFCLYPECISQPERKREREREREKETRYLVYRLGVVV